jgi:protein-S-isoprenylcysteine O-methyltransferase Ste14
MAVNKFFSKFVRIQEERGQQVITAGPYQYVRHPGYVGWMIMLAAPPVILGSLWAFIPAGLAICLVVVRAALEDGTLKAELDGYKNYAGRVRYRLLPGIW